MSGVQVLMFGDKIVSTKLKRSAQAAGNIQPALNQVAGYLMQKTAAQFDSQGRRGGGSWRKLSPKWLKFKAAHGFDTRILRMEGTLQRSVTRRKSKGQILVITPNSITFGTKLPHAAVHQFGYPPGRMPKRQFLVATPGDRDAMRNILRGHIMAHWEKTSIPAFGGGSMLRGPGGRFIGSG